MEHYSVLKEEVIDGLNIKPDGIYIDGTLGRAGHAVEVLKKLTSGHLYGFDQDLDALNKSSELLSEVSSNFTLFHRNFIYMREELAKVGVKEVSGILLDIGVSSPQFDEGERGFSYRFDGALDMRMDQSQELDAHYVVNNYEFKDLARILREYGEESFAGNIAKEIIKQRPINTTYELVEAIKKALPAKVLNKKGHPAKKTFQAIRIEVNQELANLELVIDEALKLLAINGRLAIISFHSLEDRIVKKKFQDASTVVIDKRLLIKAKDYPQANYQLVSKKPIIANEKELEENNRSHSAKLRIIERKF